MPWRRVEPAHADFHFRLPARRGLFSFRSRSYRAIPLCHCYVQGQWRLVLCPSPAKAGDSLPFPGRQPQNPFLDAVLCGAPAGGAIDRRGLFVCKRRFLSNHHLPNHRKVARTVTAGTMDSMSRCNQCGCDIPRGSGVQRTVKTGVYTEGGSYFRSVNLCDRCSDSMTSTEQTRKGRRLLVLLVVAVAAVGVVIYLVFFRK